MVQIIDLMTKADERGKLTVIERCLPFEIKRVFYIYDVCDGKDRGGHGHKKTKIALICVSGSCDVYVNNGREEQTFALSSPSCCLILEPEDWHRLSNFTTGTVMMALASEYYDKDDYFYEIKK